MSDHEPIDPELAKLFRDEPVPEPRSEARDRVFERLEAVLPVLTPPPTGGGGATGGAATRAASRLAARTVAVFVAGAVAGGGAVVALKPDPPPRIVYVDRQPPPTQPVPSPAPPPSPPPRVSPLASAAPSTVPSTTASARPPPSGNDLADERMLLEDARARLASGDAPGALAKLREHERRFPNGRLDEEREALAIQALVNAGRYDEARSRAAAFRKRSPNSVFLQVIDATIGSIP